MRNIRKPLAIIDSQEKWIKLQIVEGLEIGVSKRVRTLDEIMQSAMRRRAIIKK